MEAKLALLVIFLLALNLAFEGTENTVPLLQQNLISSKFTNLVKMHSKCYRQDFTYFFFLHRDEVCWHVLLSTLGKALQYSDEVYPFETVPS